MFGSSKARLLLIFGLLGWAHSARAQLAGTLVKGQYGLASGTQAPEALVLTPFLYDYYTTTVVGPNGNTVPSSGSLNQLLVPGLNFWYVSPLKILDANYGAQVCIWGVTPVAEFPTLNLNTSTYGFGDMYVKPVELGWHTPQVDAMAGFALWIPTGRYTVGANDNTGLGQWGYEFSAAATLWFEEDHHFNFSTKALYDIYSKKPGTVGPSQTQLQTGNILSFQGGLGYQLLHGGINIGIPYSLQFKVTPDTLPPGIGPILPGIDAAKDWSIALGAEVDLFWSLNDGVSFRWLQGFSGTNTTDGATFFLLYNHVFYFQKD